MNRRIWLAIPAAIFFVAMIVILFQQGPARGDPSGGTTTSTECQDHTLPCAGPPFTGIVTTVPVDDPARHSTTTTVIGLVLPRTS